MNIAMPQTSQQSAEQATAAPDRPHVPVEIEAAGVLLGDGEAAFWPDGPFTDEWLTYIKQRVRVRAEIAGTRTFVQWAVRNEKYLLIDYKGTGK